MKYGSAKSVPRFGALASSIVTCLLVLAGCVSITQPPNNSSSYPSGNVLAEVRFRSQVCAGTFSASLDGNDITSLFAPTPPANTPPQANLTGLVAGQHTLTARADTLQYWFLFPYCGAGSDTRTFTVQGPPPPTLGFSVGSPLNVNAGSSASLNVTASAAPSAATTVNLSSSSSRATVPATTTIAANATSSAMFNVDGQVGGSAAITAAASGFQNGTLSVNVRPVLSSLAPTSGAPGTSVTLTGQGFDSSAAVRFGNTNATTTFNSATQVTATVPMLAPAQSNVSVTVNGQASGTQSFQILAAPPPPAATLLFRTSGNDVQTFSFASNALTLLDTDTATPQGGTAVVSVAFNGASHVVRTSSVDVQSYELANNALSPVGNPASGAASGTGAAVAAVGNTIVRAVDFGLDTFQLVNGAPVRQVANVVGGTVSATGVDVDLSGNFAVRAHANGVDVFNVSNLAAPTLVGSAACAGANISSVGVGVKFVPGGGAAVRSGPQGIDVYTIAANGTPTLAGSFTGGVVSAAINTAVAINAAGTRAIRTHSTGLEVYDISNRSSPSRLGQRAGAASTTGTGAFTVGTTGFRAMNSMIEAYDISAPASIPAPVSAAATPSSVGVGLSGR